MSNCAIVCPQPVVEKIDARVGLSLWAHRAAQAALLVAVVGCLFGCRGVSSGTQTPVLPPSNTNPTPSLATGSLNPSSVVAGAQGFTLTVTGANFVASSTVEFNGSGRTTTFVSSTSLQAAITAADVAAGGTGMVTVSSPTPGGGISSGLPFTITDPAPTITSLSANSTIAGGGAFTLTVTGTNFISPSTVQWNGTARTTRFVSSTSLQAAITAADIATAGTAMVTVSNPTPGGGTSSGLAFTTNNPAPTIASLSTNSALAGGAAFTLTVTGTNFVPTSTVQWNAGARTTTFVSSTSLQVAIPAADIASGGTAMVTVSTPTPGGGTSSGLAFTTNNPAPTIASLNTTSAVAGGPTFTLTVTGTNFVPTSSVQWNAGARTTTFVSSTTLQAAITSADLATGGTNMVRVSNPVPGGGTSGSLTFTVNNPAPTAVSLNPNSAFAGDPSFTLTVTGTNFVSSSTVQWNGTARATTFVSSITLRAAITAADVNAAGTAVITVSNPTPGGGMSAPLTFTIKLPPPIITLLNPSSAVAGGTSFTLVVTGRNFVNSSSVQWNGSARTTTFVSSTQLQAAITAADIATAGMAKLTVANPIASGGVSAVSTFFVGNTGGSNFAVIAVNQAAQDIVYDRVNQVFYLSVTGTAATHPNTISLLDPMTGTITSAKAAGSNPNVLAISDDDQFLYAGIDGANKVQRFVLPGLTTDISYPLGSAPFGGGPFYALDLQVAPGAPHTTAVTLAVSSSTPSAQGGITIFDDAVARSTTAKGFGPGGGGGVLYDSLQWGADTTALFAANNEDTGFDFYGLSVSPSGVTLGHDFPSVFSSFANRIHFDAGTMLMYADEGHVIDPATGLPAGNFNTSGPMVPDSTLNTVFFISAGSSSATIQSYDLTHFTPIGAITIPNVTGGPIHLIRWGQNGLAFNTGGFGVNGQVYLVGGNFVSPAPPLALTPPPAVTPPPIPAANAPNIAVLTPSSAIAGGSPFILTITGTNFNAAATVQFNGSPLATNFISNTQLQATVAAGNILTAGGAAITVANPVASGGVSAPSTFFVGTTGGTSTSGAGFAVTVLNQASKDIVFDPAHQEIFLSVPNTSVNGNTISVLDVGTAAIVGEQYAGSNPDVLGISDDNHFLYAGIRGSSSVQRFTLPALATDLNYLLGASSGGPFFALDLQVAPGAPHTTAVTLAVSSSTPSAQGGITIFDDATARPTIAKGFGPGGGGGVLYDSLQWGSNATALFAANYEDSGFDFYVLSVNASGVTLAQDSPNIFSSFNNRIHFDGGSKLIYSNDGKIVDPATGLLVGSFAAGAPMVPDSTLNTAFFVTGGAGSTATIQSLNLTTHALIGSITVSNVTGNPQKLIRWGQNGLAFNTDGGQIFLIGGNFVH
jgi:hypothetical protein